jgi:hypothetical protein
MRSRTSVTFAALFVLGLAIRLVAMPYHGIHDQDGFALMGNRVLDLGLAHAYFGNYFPFQWQLLGWSQEISRDLEISTYTAQKLVTLLFDVGSFFMLVSLFKAWRVPARYALLYWLSPYFLLLFWLGYVDSQMGFFVLAMLVVVARLDGPSRYALGGVPLGLALLMKPQVIAPVAVIPMLVVAFLVLKRGPARKNLEALLLLVVPAVLLLGYSLYFAFSGGGFFTVANSYGISDLSGLAPSLNGGMLNIWYPVALRLKEPGEGISGVTEPHVINTVASVLAVGLIALAVVFIARTRQRIGSMEIFLALLFTTLIAPIVGPHAHESHLFLGLLLSVVLAGIARSVLLNWSLIALMAVQSLNVFAVYGLGIGHLQGPPFRITNAHLGISYVEPGIPVYRVPSSLHNTYLNHFLPQDLAVAATLCLVGVVVFYAARVTRTWPERTEDAAREREGRVLRDASALGVAQPRSL